MITISNTDYSEQEYYSPFETSGGYYSPFQVLPVNYEVIIDDFSAPVFIDAEEVTGIAANGVTYTAAIDPTDPKIGEFIWNPYTQTLEIFALSIPQSVQVSTPPTAIKVCPTLLGAPYPLFLEKLPIQGTIQLNRSFEEHPSATAELEIALPKSTILQILSPGLELDIYGLPLRIENLEIVELPRAIYPDMRCTVQINFGGRWENYLEEPVFLRNNGTNNLTTEGELDPDCAIGISSTTSSSNETSTTVTKLLNKAGIPYYGSVLKDVPIESDTPRDATADPENLLQERLRVASSFVRWSSPAGVEVLKLNGGNSWYYTDNEILEEITTSYDAIEKSSKKRLLSLSDYNPDVDYVNFPAIPTDAPIPALRNEPPTNLSFEYPNVELTGDFVNPADSEEEATQGQSSPRYIRKNRERTVRIDGDVDADTFPAGTTSIQVMSMCFDLGGPTKSRQFIYLEGETEVARVTELFGFVFHADEIYDDSRKRILGNPLEQWQLIKQVRTDLIYDENTGYLLYEYGSGFNTVRFRKESVESPETLTLDSFDINARYYKFFQIPVIKRTSRYLEIFDEYSLDNAVDWVKKCDRNGNAFLSPIYNPNWTPPYYTKRERAESTGFASTSNPENEELGENDKRQPDLVVGEESLFETRTTVNPPVYEDSIVFLNGEITRLRGEELTPQKNYTYSKKYKAQGEGMTEALQETSTTETTGETPIAPRRPPRYRKEEEDISEELADTGEEVEYRYLIQTQGYTSNDPVGGSESFAVAETLEEALTGARAKLAVENWRNGFQETLKICGNLNIKEGDKFNYRCNGEYRQRIVLSVSHTLEILGIVGEDRRITAVTSLTLGRYFFPALTNSKHKLPQAGEQEPISGSALIVHRKNLGQILGLEGIHRRNYNG